jgi:hypothetical protein
MRLASILRTAVSDSTLTLALPASIGFNSAKGAFT